MDRFICWSAEGVLTELGLPQSEEESVKGSRQRLVEECGVELQHRSDTGSERTSSQRS